MAGIWSNYRSMIQKLLGYKWSRGEWVPDCSHKFNRWCGFAHQSTCKSMVYAINISCYYFAFPEHTSHHGLNTSLPRVTLSGRLRSAIIPICARHSDNGVFSKSASTRCLTLNIDENSESTHFTAEANRRRYWGAQRQGQVHWMLFQMAPAALSPQRGDQRPQPSPAAMSSPAATSRYPKATPPTPQSVSNAEVPSLFNGCLAPGVLSRFLGCNEQTAGTKRRWFFLSLITIWHKR